MLNLSSLYKTLLIPLIALLTLILLVGGTAYQLSRTWGDEVSDVQKQISQTLVLNNIRWNLRQIQENRKSNPARAQLIWENTKQQVALLAQAGESSKTYSMLQAFMQKESNIEHISTALQQPIFMLNTEAIQSKFSGLQEYTRSVTIGITLCMLILGSVLMIVMMGDLEKFYDQLIQSRDLSTSIQESERHRIAQDLHDAVIQELVDLKRHYEPTKVDALVTSIRRICHNLKPQVLEDLGFMAAVEFLADDLRTHKINVQLSLDEEGLCQLPKGYELPLFRVIQELFNNIKRHSQATQTGLTLVFNPTESLLLRLYLQDNGQGFNPKAVTTGMGLAGVQERIQQIEGRIKIESSPGKGTQYQIMIPIKMVVNATSSSVQPA